METVQIEVIVRESGLPLRTLRLAPGSHLVGRGGDCPIRLKAPDVSRQHARLTWTGSELHLEDLGSKTGIRVDGEQLHGKTVVSLPRTVQVGSASLELSRPESEAAAAAPEERLKGLRYRIESTLAEGGMGTIYAVRDLHVGRLVAMKVAREQPFSSDDTRRRFLREAEVLGQLEHPNIVPLYELGIDPAGRAFYAMRYIHGITLAKALAGLADGTPEVVTRFPLGPLLTVFQKACDAVAFAHSKRVIHRDLKPENIMVGNHGEVLVMDWGLAKVLPRPAAPDDRTISGSGVSGGASPQVALTLDGQVLGTPRFMAPEQAEGRVDDMDPRTDIFTLGCMLYNILTLRPPLGALPLDVALEKLRRGEVPPPAHFNNPAVRLAEGTAGASGFALLHCPGGRIPEVLSALTMKAMATDPRRRHQRVEDLQRDIAAYQQSAVTEKPAGVFRKWRERVSQRRAATP